MPHLYLHHALATTCILVAAAIISQLHLRFLPDRHMDARATVFESLWMAVLWGVTLGPALYLNRELLLWLRQWGQRLSARPVLGPSNLTWWDPRLSVVDKALFWVLFVLFALVLLRTLVHPRWRPLVRVVTFGLGVAAAYGVRLGFIELFG